MNILYLTTVLPSNRRTGGELATQCFVDTLRELGNCVTVVGYQRMGECSNSASNDVSVGFRHIETSGAGRTALVWLFSAYLGRRAYSVQKYLSSNYLSTLKTILRRNSFDLVILDHSQLGFLLNALPETIPLVFLPHNVEKNVYKDLSKIADNFFKRNLYAREARLIGDLERSIAARAKQIWTLTESDKLLFNQLCETDKASVVAIPSGDVSKSCSDQKIEYRCECGLLGTWTWKSNGIGLDWFLNEVVTLLPSDLRIHIAGKGTPSASPSNVFFKGYVADAKHYLQTCKVICIPARAGGGIQIKTLDAIATGRPIVATSIAVRGLGSLPKSVRIVDEPTGFAAAIVDLAQNAFAELDSDAIVWTQRRRETFLRQIAANLSSL